MGKRKYKYANGRKTASNNEELINHYINTVNNNKKKYKYRKNYKNNNNNAQYDVYSKFEALKKMKVNNNNNKYNNKFTKTKHVYEISDDSKSSSESESDSHFNLINKDNNNKESEDSSVSYVNLDKRKKNFKSDDDDDNSDSSVSPVIKRKTITNDILSFSDNDDDDDVDNSDNQSDSNSSSKDEDEEEEESEDDNEDIKMHSDIVNTNNEPPISKANDQTPFNPSYPWLSETTTKLSGILRLHSEILDFYKFMSPTPTEIARTKTIYKLISFLIKTKFPSFTIKLFGSNSTQLNLPSSDLDIVVIPPTPLSSLKQTQEQIFNILHSIFKQNPNFNHIRFIPAKVPILKVKYQHKIEIDISLGRKNGYAATKTINTILAQYPSMRPILILLKYYLRQRSLNETYTGGLSSFGLFSLVYAYMQYLQKTKQNGQICLGHILVGLLDFYGFRFNYAKVGISVRYGGYFYKRSERLFLDNSKGSGMLSLENFQNIEQDIGGNCFKFDKVVDAFKEAYWSLCDFGKDEEEDETMDKDKERFSYLGRFIKVDKLIKGRGGVSGKKSK
jgi:non-canonical poly(A) RNA polymerase PAPD5/7